MPDTEDEMKDVKLEKNVKEEEMDQGLGVPNPDISVDKMITDEDEIAQKFIRESQSGHDFTQYAYVERAYFLSTADTVLFAHPDKDKAGRTQWITGKEYSDLYLEVPSIAHMENVRTIVRDAAGNYYPKASFASHAEVPKGTPEKDKWKVRSKIVSETLSMAGLSGKNYSGLVEQPNRPENNKWSLAADKRLVETATGPRKQQLQYKYPQHAGLENENVLLTTPDGKVYSFDIATDENSPSVEQLEQHYGGTVHLKSEGSNGYESLRYLKDRYGDTAPKNRYNSQMNIDTNTNQNLPQVGILLEGRLFDVKTILRNRDANPPLAAALERGDKAIAHLVKVRSRTGGYHSAEYARKTDGPNFAKIMSDNGIDEQVGRHIYTKEEDAKNRMESPKALIDIGERYLETDQAVRLRLGPGETIASKYAPDKILVTNTAKDLQPTGFYRQIGTAVEAKELGKVHPASIRNIHTDVNGIERQYLAKHLTPPVESSVYQQGSFSTSVKYDERRRTDTVSR